MRCDQKVHAFQDNQRISRQFTDQQSLSKIGKGQMVNNLSFGRRQKPKDKQVR